MNKPEHLRLIQDEPPVEGGRAPSAPPPDPLLGRVIDGRYQIERLLGEGGMGFVYKAKHTTLGKQFAIKVLRPEVVRNEEIVTRFRTEAQSASGIGHDHIIDITDFGSLPDGSTYFVMEYLDGRSLSQVLEEERPFDPKRTVHLALQLADALGAAHERNIVHRDLKPDNIFLIKRRGTNDFVKVLDFGIAKVAGATTKLTKAGQVFGTPHYMSPEQCAGTAVDHRTDIYALGVILYEMASGRVPFDSDNLMGILTKHLYEKPQPPHELPPPVNVPAGLEAVILKCLEKNKETRYQSMSELASDLTRVKDGLTPAAVMQAVERRSNAGTRPPDGTSKSSLRISVGPPEPKGKKRSLLKPILALAGLGAVGAVAAAWIAFGGGNAAHPHRTPPRPQPLDVVEPPSPARGESAQQAAGITGSGTHALRSVRIDSIPSGATLFGNDGTVVGTCPISVDKPQTGSVQFKLKLTGYEDMPFSISSLTADSIRVPLDAARTAARPASATGGHRRRRQEAPAQGGATPRPPQEENIGGATRGELADPWAQ